MPKISIGALATASMLAAATPSGTASSPDATAPMLPDTVRVRAKRDEGIAPPKPFDALPPRVVRALAVPSHVEVALMDPDPNFEAGDPRATLPKISAFAVRSERRALPPASGIRVGQLILSEQFWNPGTKTCLFNPNVAYFFGGGSEEVVLLVCHGCAAVWFLAPDLPHTFREIDHVNLDLLRIADAAFPGDSTITSLIERAQKHPPPPTGAGPWGPSVGKSN